MNMMNKVYQLLEKAQIQLKVWDEVIGGILTQLSSLANVVEQLETLQRCSSSGKLGVIHQHPMVVQLLQGKLVKAMERILGVVNSDRVVLREVVQKLKRYAKEGQAAFEEMTKQQGLEVSCARTAEDFSPGDYVSWLRQLHCAHRSDLDEKLTALQSLQYNTESTSCVCTVWEKRPPGVEECLRYLAYTVNCS